ncbi:MAG: FixH family protein [Salibacteraceae bacterium]
MKLNRIFKTISLLAVSATLTFAVSSCNPEGCTDDTATNYDSKAKKDDGSCTYAKADYDVTGLKEVGSGYAAGAQIKIYSKMDLFAGYNFLYILTLDSASGDYLGQGHMSINPMMDMGTMMHSAPVENPTSDMPTMNGLYEAQVFFVMPSMAGTWELNVEYHNHDLGSTAIAAIPVTVMQSTDRVMASFRDSTTAMNTPIFLGYVLPEEPQIGLNDIEIVVFYRKDMNTWPAENGVTLEIEPTMPSMGHGSPNNVNPTFMGDGHYKGKVNYTMSGLWKIDVKVSRSGNVISNNTYFEVTL